MPAPKLREEITGNNSNPEVVSSQVTPESSSSDNSQDEYVTPGGDSNESKNIKKQPSASSVATTDNPILKQRISFGDNLSLSIEGILAKYPYVVVLPQVGGFGDTVFFAKHPFYVHDGWLNTAYWDKPTDVPVFTSQKFSSQSSNQIIQAISNLGTANTYTIINDDNSLAIGNEKN